MSNTSTQQQRAEAKLRAAIAAMKPAMKAASTAAHELMALNPDEENDFESMMMLGHIAQVLGQLCPAHAMILRDILYEHFVNEESHDDTAVSERAH
jgi:hypothetical protein